MTRQSEGEEKGAETEAHIGEKDRILGLFKFGRREHLEPLVSKGLLYMNTLQYFQELESDEVRADQNEGLFAYGAFGKYEMRWDPNNDGNFKPLPVAGPLVWRGGGTDDLNVYCMYALRASQLQRSGVDSQNFGFGDAFVYFLNGDAFLARVRNRLNELGLEYYIDLVQYLNAKDFAGEMGPFRKFDNFAYQSELRIVVKAKKKAPLILELGDLSEIAQLHPKPLSQINDQFSPKPAAFSS
ncbi:MAG: hypothetical protein KDD42_03210 [Bdellovibrionales bacterium]|nr:hypothetical protein [Bdellovibrionales bacterium]